MMEYIKSYTLRTMKKKLILLYVCNVTDILFTFFLVNTGYYREINLVMISAMKNPFAGFAIKTILPAALLFYLYQRLQNATEWQLKISNFFLNLINLFYILVNGLHLINFMILPLFLLRQ